MKLHPPLSGWHFSLNTRKWFVVWCLIFCATTSHDAKSGELDCPGRFATVAECFAFHHSADIDLSSVELDGNSTDSLHGSASSPVAGMDCPGDFASMGECFKFYHEQTIEFTNTTVLEPIEPDIPDHKQTVFPWTNTVVKEVQTMLWDMGFDPGPVDGVLGKKTCAAARRAVKNAIECYSPMMIREALLKRNNSNSNEGLSTSSTVNKTEAQIEQMCNQIGSWTNGGLLIDSWSNKATARLELLTEHQFHLQQALLELNSIQGDINSLQNALGEVGRIVGNTLKISTGIGFASSAYAKHQGSVLFFGGMLSAFTAGETVGKMINGSLEFDLVDLMQSLQKETFDLRHLTKIAQQSVKPFLEGGSGLQDIVARERERSNAILAVNDQISKVILQMADVESKIQSNQTYKKRLEELKMVERECFTGLGLGELK